MKVLCVFGKHAYGDESRGLSPEYLAFLPALARSGHQAILFDSWNRNGFDHLGELNTRLLQTVERERPDMMLFVPFLYEIWLETLLIIKNRGILSLCWTTDDSWKYDQQSKFIAHAFDAITTTYPDIFARYKERGIENVLLTQWAAPADALAPPLPAEKCTFAVTFVGANHGTRRSRLQWLARRGIHVEAFGYGWPNGTVSVPRMREVIRQSVISLNFANSRGDNQIKARTFEVPGAGGFLLTENAPGLDRFYRLGEEIEAFDDMEQLEVKIKHYLADRDKRDAIARRGFERTRAEHTYDARLAELIRFAGERRDRRAAGGEAAAPVTLDAALQRHRIGAGHRIIRAVLVTLATLVVGRRRSRRAARRVLFELSARLAGATTYAAAGLPGRLFPKD
jgi:spore maturation protein CgeB